MADEPRITVSKNGPYLVSGNAPLRRWTIEADAAGESEEWTAGEELHRHPRYALCRCGHSGSKPLCDGSHTEFSFDGTETADRATYEEQADVIEGPVVSLLDAVPLCADARFCHRDRIWALAETAERDDDVEAVRRAAERCPSGRYTAVETATAQAEEPAFEPSIGIVDDPSQGVAGPIWVRGGIPVVSADGETYEVRNRQTLCRCGASSNKPFCDGSHLEVGFRE